MYSNINKRAVSTGLTFIILALSLAINPPELKAQMNQTLFGWEDEVKQMIFNRYDSHGGIFYDRGLFRFTTPLFTDEHDLDLITHSFNSTEHYSWYYDEPNGFRTFMGSYNLGQFLHGAEIRHRVELTDRLSFPIRMIRRFDMRQDRAMAILALDYRISEDHSVGALHTLNETKPDMDLLIYYRFGDLRSRGIQLEFSPLDWANNSAYALGQRRGTETPELRRYEVKPYLFSFKSNVSFYDRFRFESMGGIQTPLKAVAESMPDTHPDQSFIDRDFARYGGFLLEYADPAVTLGLSFQHTYTIFSRTDEENDRDDPIDYGNRQIQNRFGIFAGFQWRNFYSQNRVWRNYNLDVQRDEYETRQEHGIEVYPFDFREFRWQMQLRLGYNLNERGFTSAIEFSSDYRRPTENYVIADGFESRGLPFRAFYMGTVGLRNERLSLQTGYRFNKNTYFVVGASLDLDGDIMGSYWDRQERENRSWFDGGYGRFVIHWD